MHAASLTTLANRQYLPQDFEDILSPSLAEMDSEELDEVALHRLNEQEHPEIAPHTCEFCQQIVFNTDLMLLSGESHEEVTTITVAECLDAANRGCAFVKALKGRDFSTFVKTFCVAVEIVIPRGGFGNGAMISVLHIDASSVDEHGVTFVLTLGYFELYMPVGQQRLRSELNSTKDGDEHLLNSCLPPNLVPGSRLSQRRARKWLQECERSHLKCRAFQRAFRPKRLLEITDNGALTRLVSSASDQGNVRYATLSYCWGDNQPMQTTRASIQDFSASFATKDLPASIQDGVMTAHRLGFAHLWVDALCIVQDDEEDVQEHIAQMYKIYASSTLTISASSACASSQGFLQPQLDHTPSLLTARSGSGTISQVIAFPHMEIATDPLHQRAWALQENCITPRVLTFSKSTMNFVCIESEHTDGGRDDDGEWLNVDGPFINPGLKYLKTLAHPIAWTNLIIQYSQLCLTIPSDRLPAFAAIAEEYARRIPVTRYVAGLWWEDLPWQLLWKIVGTDEPRVVGPSWSWCSITGGVCYPKPFESLLDFTCSLKAASTDLISESNHLGQVKSGRLVLSGRVRSMNWIYPGIRDPLHFHNMTGEDRYPRWVPVSSDYRNVRLRIDAVSEWPKNTDIASYAIEICRGSYDSERLMRTRDHALILQKLDATESDNVYRRIGILEVGPERGIEKDRHWFDECSTDMEITII